MSSITQLAELNILKLTQFRDFTKNKTLETFIPLEELSEKYQISETILWQCLLALKVKPQKLEEKIYLTAQDLKQLEQFIKRIEISWACPNILATCRRSRSASFTDRQKT